MQTERLHGVNVSLRKHRVQKIKATNRPKIYNTNDSSLILFFKEILGLIEINNKIYYVFNLETEIAFGLSTV